ncbi:methyltransferase-like protein 16 [Chenopodium quinoa]|uniref:methyltransferase-like protein 16 n=1 Tax=Chenopodium quinoa TaxID=63459 RepID=UPI000B772148|nr:methyltransferase-like protein 16 [Chenopodium quinoa]XP_021753108.1 methyltransferase-like protein 16 [Chenopodium quinoa]XP_021753109.1 methyltransferase-like protein 16 [Chenopodium quinoa]
MGSKKRKRGGGGGGGSGERRSIHPRNRYADNPPDFSLLASLYPSFSSFVFYSRDGRPRIDWTDFNATRELTRVLLLHDHSLNWWIPDGQLCPTVPNRSNYIHWIEDLLASDIIEKNNVDGDKVRGFDIGTGANCIYPLLGASLLGWSFVGSDVTGVALEWAEKNVKSNPHILELIEIRRVEVAEPANDCETLHLDGNMTRDDFQEEEDVDDLTKQEMREFDESAVIHPQGELDIVHSVNGEEVEGLDERRDGEAQAQSLNPPDEPKIDKGYHGPPILLGVVKEGEKFDFCMCNPPFFESMEEAGLNPKTSCGGTPKEMVCPGGEGAFISRIIEDSVALKQSFRWYTSMLGKKSNLKFLMSKLREVGVTIVKATEFVQGQTSRWGLAWSFMPPAKKLVSSHVRGNSSPSFMLEGLQHQTSAFDVLHSVESFFSYFGVSCKCNDSSFTVEVSATNDYCDTILKTDVKKLDEASTCLRVAEISRSANCSNSPVNLSFRILVFQQIPGTLLVKASLKPGDNTLAGIFTSVFQQLEEFLKHKFCRKKARV